MILDCVDCPSNHVTFLAFLGTDQNKVLETCFPVLSWPIGARECYMKKKIEKG